MPFTRRAAPRIPSPHAHISKPAFTPALRRALRKGAAAGVSSRRPLCSFKFSAPAVSDGLRGKRRALPGKGFKLLSLADGRLFRAGGRKHRALLPAAFPLHKRGGKPPSKGRARPMAAPAYPRGPSSFRQRGCVHSPVARQPHMQPRHTGRTGGLAPHTSSISLRRRRSFSCKSVRLAVSLCAAASAMPWLAATVYRLSPVQYSSTASSFSCKGMPRVPCTARCAACPAPGKASSPHAAWAPRYPRAPHAPHCPARTPFSSLPGRTPCAACGPPPL